MCSPICCDFLLVFLAIIFPPLPVWIKRGICSADSLINILLCMLGLVPGVIHSWYIIAKYPLVIIHEDLEAQTGHFSHVYIQVQQSPAQSPSPQPTYQAQQPPQASYGSINDNPPAYSDNNDRK